MQISTIRSNRVDVIKNVAAYARVSTLQEEQRYSFESQKAYYETLIESNSKWRYAGIYADPGFSGTTQNRPQFQKLIADAKAGRIDLILVKSISRFSRNVVDTQNIVHDLKAHNVEVYFEEQNLSSFNRNAEMVLNMMAMVAENESRSISQNTRWSLDRLAQQGIRRLGNNRVFGYDEIDGVLKPNENAKYVKFIFEAYVSGIGRCDIMRALQKMGVKSQKGGDVISEGTIRGMLRNEIYCGDRLIQKQPPRDFLTQKPNYSVDYVSYYVEDHHEAIISRELWKKAQAKLDAKQAEVTRGIYRRTDSHFLAGRVVCGNCGSPYRRITVGPEGNRKTVWKCRDRHYGKKGKGCKNKILEEKVLFLKLNEIIGMKGEGAKADYEKIMRVIVDEVGALTVEYP